MGSYSQRLILGLALFWIAAWANASSNSWTDAELSAIAYRLSMNEAVGQRIDDTAKESLSGGACVDSPEFSCLFLARMKLYEFGGFMAGFGKAFPYAGIEKPHVFAAVKGISDFMFEQEKTAVDLAYESSHASSAALQNMLKCRAELEESAKQICLDQPMREKFIYMGLSRFRMAENMGLLDVFNK